jgi:hypothetical protein
MAQRKMEQTVAQQAAAVDCGTLTANRLLNIAIAGWWRNISSNNGLTSKLNTSCSGIAIRS